MKGSGKKLVISFNSPVILGFTLICFAALILDNITFGVSNKLVFSVYHSSLLDPLTYVRFVGHIFGHANWEHFIGNIMMILIIGPLLEEKYGSKKMFSVILVTAVITGIVNYVFFPNIRLLGASGVACALILLSSFTSMKRGSIPFTFILVTLIYIGQQVYQGIFIDDNVSNITHIIGGFVGAFFGYLLNRKNV